LLGEDRCLPPPAQPAGICESLVERLHGAKPEGRFAILASAVETAARRVMRLETGVPLDRERPLREFGLESLLALDLRNELAESLGRPLPASLVFDHPTVAKLAAGLLPYAGFSEPAADAPDSAAQQPEPGLEGLTAAAVARRLEDRVNAILGTDK
jgi:hypothetical protein